jgi:hypothetical protein
MHGLIYRFRSDHPIAKRMALRHSVCLNKIDKIDGRPRRRYWRRSAKMSRNQRPRTRLNWSTPYLTRARPGSYPFLRGGFPPKDAEPLLFFYFCGHCSMIFRRNSVSRLGFINDLFLVFSARRVRCQANLIDLFAKQ